MIDLSGSFITAFHRVVLIGRFLGPVRKGWLEAI